MSTYFGLSIDQATNDLHLTADSNLATVTDAEAVGQHARQRLNTFEGEWFYDTTAGVPWIGEILGQSYDPALAEAVIKAEIADTKGVTGITSFSVRFDRQTRGITAHSITVETEFDQEANL